MRTLPLGDALRQQGYIGDRLPSITYQTKPTMINKLTMIAELFELDIIGEDEALKACKTVIGQHAKVKSGPVSGDSND